MKVFQENMLGDIQPKPLNAYEQEVLWSAIEHRILEQPAKTSFFSFTLLKMHMRAISVAALLVVFVTGSFAATVAAASNAKPGDSLFPVQLALEKVRIAVTPTSAGKTKLRIAFSQKHLAEVKDIIMENRIVIGPTIATSTATSTPVINADAHRIDRAAKAQKALTFSIDYLDKVKQDVRSSGTREDIKKVNDLVSQVTTITEEHVSELKNVADQSEGQQDQKEHIKAEEMIKELRVKMKNTLRILDKEKDSKEKEKLELPQNSPPSFDPSRPTSTPKTIQNRSKSDEARYPKHNDDGRATPPLPESATPATTVTPSSHITASSTSNIKEDIYPKESDDDDSSR